MPQLLLEYSANVIEKDKITAVFPLLHAVLSQDLPAQLGNCKSRAVECKDYYIADGQPQQAFILVNLTILAGRSEETLQKVGEKLIAVLKQHFSASLNKLQLQIFLEIDVLEKHYFKITSAEPELKL
ncbi:MULTISPECIES: 5-carboxymethyl-2-hydroxymuconate Delta-isomerase [Legionella]|uniref:5-carboxymethyl-2-hydroxymuconate Delta-isomerase n=1 Tax=Legionella donaldsonii TaxID=45060 RepID=A0A378JBC7_9GAMM|nr:MULTISPECIES: 5-carboxymethyl-2-hydroxymuconate Delta-isomerase [Legionella]MCC5013568.1 5-carboxymethyl-2-hydroxymuconate Delta-isomerase [Legionella sp. 31fI33]STX44187.1 5-carboxymethyl-2-hydroxymuconate Delta-isomerase [Legionella donaldsonii]